MCLLRLRQSPECTHRDQGIITDSGPSESGGRVLLVTAYNRFEKVGRCGTALYVFPHYSTPQWLVEHLATMKARCSQEFWIHFNAETLRKGC